MSVPEGDDKPLKYPLMFSVGDVLIVRKVDYLELSDFDISKLRERVLSLNPNVEIFEASSETGQGNEEWLKWLEKSRLIS